MKIGRREKETGEHFVRELTWKMDVYRYADSSLMFGPAMSSSVSLKPDEFANFLRQKGKRIRKS